MIRFTNDYSEGAHPSILAALAETNTEGNFGYSTDPHTARAHALIREAIGCPDADVHLLVGGTQTNATAIAAFLRPFEAVISADTGHICVHETGAIEATGHKCIACPNVDGKLTPEAIRAACAANTTEHMVRPRMVYISQATELGTLYSRAELEALRAVCDEEGLYLYLDGARLAVALDASDVTLPDLGRLCDAFYIGGTKNGALIGEALVLVNDALKPDFRYHIKQRGGMLAKGWLLGIQFEQLMQNGLYTALGAHANALALQLKEGIAALGYPFLCDSVTNQQFPILPDTVVEALGKDFSFEINSKPNATHTCIRLVTSWATQPEAVAAFLAALKSLTA
jgi:threonine aldolase